jgi:hypothetical protein
LSLWAKYIKIRRISMVITLKDFVLNAPEWLIDEFLPLGHRAMDTAPEGCFKTQFGCWLAICIAAGKPVFGKDVFKGPVMIVDEESPPASLDKVINRFCSGLGVKLGDLDLYRFSMEGFRFGVKSELTKLIDKVKVIKPVFIRMDSLLAMIPSGKTGLGENYSNLGEIISDDLTAILKATENQCSILISAHSKKSVSEMTLEEVDSSDMQTLVRGHGSIVGEGCDTGFAIHRESKYPEPTRFSLLTKPRRDGIPMAQYPALIELVEERYAGGWARLEKIDNALIPPSSFALSLYPFLSEVYTGGGNPQRTAEEIVRKHAFMTKSQCHQGMFELFSHKVIVNGNKPQSFTLNPNEKEVEAQYLKILKTKKTI